MIDLRTLLVLLAVADLLVAAAMLMGVGRGAREGIAHWASALVVRTLASVLFLAGAAQAEGAVGLAAGLLALSITLQGAGLLAFSRRAMPAWIHTAAIAAVALPVQMVERDPGLAMLYAGTVIGVLLLGVAAIAAQAHVPGAARRLMVGSFIAAGVATLGRAAASGFELHPVDALLAPSGLGGAALLVVFASTLAASMALLLQHKERAESDVVRLADLDPLTGAYNRRAFDTLAGEALREAQGRGTPLSIVMADIDHFSQVLDAHGHAGSEALLVRFAELTRSTLRHEDLLGRFGGDSFVVLLPGMPGPAAVALAGRLRRAVEDLPLDIGGEQVAITVSIGLSARIDEAPDEEETVDTMLQRAAAALRLAKQRGRNRVVALSLGSSVAA